MGLLVVESSRPELFFAATVSVDLVACLEPVLLVSVFFTVLVVIEALVTFTMDVVVAIVVMELLAVLFVAAVLLDILVETLQELLVDFFSSSRCFR